MQNVFYNLPNKWNQISVFIDKELRLLQNLCWNKDNYHRFGFEIINQVINNKGKIFPHTSPNMKILDIDSYKDLDEAKKIVI